MLYTFVCNKISKCLDNWGIFTQNQFVLRIVRQGVEIQFINNDPPSRSKPRYYELDRELYMHLAKEVATLLDKKAIEKVQPEDGGVCEWLLCEL